MMLTNIHKMTGLLFINIVFVFFITILFFYRTEPKAVVFDMNTTYTSFLKQAAAQRVSTSDMRKIARNFTQALGMAVNKYAKKHHVVIYTKAAIIAGAKDVTPNIQLLIEQNMRQLNNKEKKEKNA